MNDTEICCQIVIRVTPEASPRTAGLSSRTLAGILAATANRHCLAAEAFMDGRQRHAYPGDTLPRMLRREFPELFT